MRHLGFAGGAFRGILFWRGSSQRLYTGRAYWPPSGKSELDPSMGCSWMGARNPIAPYGIHKASIEIVWLENVHVAVENSVTLFRHRVLLCFDQSRTKKRFIVTLTKRGILPSLCKRNPSAQRQNEHLKDP